MQQVRLKEAYTRDCIALARTAMGLLREGLFIVAACTVRKKCERSHTVVNAQLLVN